MSQNYRYLLSDFPESFVNEEVLWNSIVASEDISETLENVGCIVVSAVEYVDITFSDALTQDAIDALGAIISAHVAWKGPFFKAIDQRTHELIDAGYTYSGVVLSASQQAQDKISLLWADRANLTFPFDLSAKCDNCEPNSVVDVDDLEAIVDALRAHIQAKVESGNSLKAQIRSATTKAQAEAVEDTR